MDLEVVADVDAPEDAVEVDVTRPAAGAGVGRAEAVADGGADVGAGPVEHGRAVDLRGDLGERRLGKVGGEGRAGEAEQGSRGK